MKASHCVVATCAGHVRCCLGVYIHLLHARFSSHSCGRKFAIGKQTFATRSVAAVSVLVVVIIEHTSRKTQPIQRKRQATISTKTH